MPNTILRVDYQFMTLSLNGHQTANAIYVLPRHCQWLFSFYKDLSRWCRPSRGLTGKRSLFSSTMRSAARRVPVIISHISVFWNKPALLFKYRNIVIAITVNITAEWTELKTSGHTENKTKQIINLSLSLHNPFRSCCCILLSQKPDRKYWLFVRISLHYVEF